MEAQREMTLKEVVEKMPECHLAHRQYKELLEKNFQIEALDIKGKIVWIKLPPEAMTDDVAKNALHVGNQLRKKGALSIMLTDNKMELELLDEKQLKALGYVKMEASDAKV